MRIGSETWLSLLFRGTLDRLVPKLYLLELDRRGITVAELRKFQAAMRRYGSPDECAVGAIDGTSLPIPRPGGRGQELQYSGHYKMHCNHFLAIVMPNGLAYCCVGPFSGSTPDALAFKLAGMDDVLWETLVASIGGSTERFTLLADGGFGMTANIVTRFRLCRADEQGKVAYNLAHARSRIIVEHFFGALKSKFRMFEVQSEIFGALGSLPKPADRWAYDPKLGDSFRAAVLLFNLITCASPRGNEISQEMDLLPPSLEEYLATPDRIPAASAPDRQRRRPRRAARQDAGELGAAAGGAGDIGAAAAGGAGGDAGEGAM